MDTLATDYQVTVDTLWRGSKTAASERLGETGTLQLVILLSVHLLTGSEQHNIHNMNFIYCNGAVTEVFEMIHHFQSSAWGTSVSHCTATVSSSALIVTGFGT